MNTANKLTLLRVVMIPAFLLVLYLDVDLPTSLKRMQHRQEKLNTKADIHEQDEAYLEN